jgi:DnaJ family protein C protein 9
MAAREESLFDEEPPAIEPYTTLGISKDATADEVKSAYRKAALKHHPGTALVQILSWQIYCPILLVTSSRIQLNRIILFCVKPPTNHFAVDKAPANLQDDAKLKFQEIAFAYAVLSDPVRRKRYDVTGSTSESIDFDGFSWSEFYQEQFRDVVTADAIEQFAKGYKNSPEEKDDVLEAYRQSKGRWSDIYETVMLSDPLEDEDRFRTIIDDAIAKGEVEAYKAYTKETKKDKTARMKAARKEGEEALAYARELGVEEKLFGTGKGRKKESCEDALSALIKKNQAGRSSFLDQLEAKYAGNSKSSKGKKSRLRDLEDDVDDAHGMPSEEAFQAAAAKLKGKKSAAGDDASDGRKAKRAKR